MCRVGSPLADPQTGHNRLARAGIVGEQEPHARQLEEVLVDRLELVRQRIDLRDRQAEVGVELVGDAQGVSLEAQPPPSSPSTSGASR